MDEWWFELSSWFNQCHSVIHFTILQALHTGWVIWNIGTYWLVHATWICISATSGNISTFVWIHSSPPIHLKQSIRVRTSSLLSGTWSWLGCPFLQTIEILLPGWCIVQVRTPHYSSIRTFLFLFLLVLGLFIHCCFIIAHSLFSRLFFPAVRSLFQLRFHHRCSSLIFFFFFWRDHAQVNWIYNSSQW